MRRKRRNCACNRPIDEIEFRRWSTTPAPLPGDTHILARFFAALRMTQKSCKLQGNAGSFLGTGVALSASVARGSPHTWQRYCAVKLHTFRVPLDVLFTKAPQWSKLVTVFCSVRKAKFVPTVCSEPPAGVTKTE